MTLCVYALSAPGIGRVASTGIAGERLRLVPVGAIVAIVGEISRAPRPTEDHLRKYDRVVQALFRRTPALLPARHGTYVRDVYELALILGARQDALRRRLKAVRISCANDNSHSKRACGVRPTGKKSAPQEKRALTIYVRSLGKRRSPETFHRSSRCAPP